MDFTSFLSYRGFPPNGVPYNATEADHRRLAAAWSEWRNLGDY